LPNPGRGPRKKEKINAPLAVKTEKEEARPQPTTKGEEAEKNVSFVKSGKKKEGGRYVVWKAGRSG